MSRKVLVVDDEKLIVKGIRYSLEQDGMEVDCAYDGEEALNMVKEKEGKDGVFRRICVEGKTAGNISVERKDDVFCHDAELGYVLDRPYWSKGIMREAVRMITAEAMETLALARISAQVYSPNIASRRVLEHNGFQQEGLLPQAVWKDGMTYDLILYGILRDPGKKD